MSHHSVACNGSCSIGTAAASAAPRGDQTAKDCDRFSNHDDDPGRRNDGHAHDDRSHDGHAHDGHAHDEHSHDARAQDEHSHDAHAHAPDGNGRGHAHSHGHDHRHGHLHLTQNGVFGVAVGLNLLFAAVEVGAGVVSSSMSLVADAAHNLGDSMGLLLAWGAAVLARAAPSSRRTWGLRRSTILAALANALLIFGGVGAVVWEAVHRLRQAPLVEGKTMMVVASIGVVINAGTALLFHKDKEHDANVRGAFLHLAADAGVSLGVVGAGLVISMTGARWVDPLVSLLVSLAIFASTWSLLRQALDLALDAVPDHIDPDEVRRYLERLPCVRRVHDFHVWPTSTTETALTAHVELDTATAPKGLLSQATRELRARYRIDHVTLQLEPNESEDHSSSPSRDYPSSS